MAPPFKPDETSDEIVDMTPANALQEDSEDIEDMTPARFDLLYLVRTKRYVWMTVTQESLWKRLGVDPSTVSKMLTRLVELGWVEKEKPSEGNRRTRSVWRPSPAALGTAEGGTGLPRPVSGPPRACPAPPAPASAARGRPGPCAARALTLTAPA